MQSESNCWSSTKSVASRKKKAKSRMDMTMCMICDFVMAIVNMKIARDLNRGKGSVMESASHVHNASVAQPSNHYFVN